LGIGDTKIIAMNKTITGRIGDKTITITITPYQPNIPEQILTAKKKILDDFATQGYDPSDVTFE